MARIGTAYVDVQPDMSAFSRALDRDLARVDRKFKSVGDSAGRDFSASLQRSLGNGSPFAAMTADANKAGAAIEGAGRKGAKGLDEMGAAVKRADGIFMDASGRWREETGRFVSTTRKAELGLDNLGDGAGRGGRGLDGLGGIANFAGHGLSALGAAALTSAPLIIALGAATFAAGAALGPLIGLAAAGAGAIAALGQGFGVAKLATAGLGDALKEQTAAQGAAASAALNGAAQQRAAAQAIAAAQEAVRGAKEQLRQATMRVSDAERNQADASTALAAAQKAAVQAQSALSGARTEARRALVDMRASLDDAILTEQRSILSLQDAKAALKQTLAGASPEDLVEAERAVTAAATDQEQAVLNLEKARASLTGVMADATATDIEKRQAILDVKQAEEALTRSQSDSTKAQKDLDKLRAGPTDREKREALLRVTEAENAAKDAVRERGRQQSDYNAIEKAGIEGSAQVIAAQADIASANDRVRDAQRAAADASRQVGEANRALIEANRGVDRATRGVTEAQLSAKESAAGAAIAAGKLNEKLNALPAPAQAFVRQLVAMKPRLDELRSTAAAGFFPGATEGLQAATRNFGPLNRVVAQTATVLGDLARKAGELIGSAGFGRDLETIGGRNARTLEIFGDAALHVVSALRHVMVAAGPLQIWLAQTVKGWAASAEASAEAGRKTGAMAAFFERTRAIAERLGSVLKNLTGGLLGMGRAADDSGNSIWESIDRAAKRFNEWANSTKGQASLKAFFEDARDLAAALVPVLAGITAGFALLGLRLLPLQTVLEFLGPIADELTVAFVAYKIAATAAAAATGLWTAALAAHPITLVVVALAALAAGLVIAYRESETFRNAVDEAFAAVKDAAQILTGVADVAGAAWGSFGDIVLKQLDAVSEYIESYVKNAVKLLGGFVDFIAGVFTGDWERAWDGIKAIFGAIFDQMIAGFKLGIATFKNLAEALGRTIIEVLKALAGAYLDVGKFITGKIGEGFKTMVSGLADIGGWLKNRVTELVAAAGTGFVDVGKYVTNRIGEGFKTVTSGLADIGGWLKNRVAELVAGAALGLVDVGKYVTNRLGEGIKTITAALGDVGGWLRNRVSDFVRAEAEGLTSIGTFITNRLGEGIKTVTSAISDVGGWVRNRVREAIESVRDGFTSIGRSMMNWIIDGLEAGGNKLVGFVNKIIGVLNKIPGVDIGKIKEFRAGGTTEEVPGFAQGGMTHHDRLKAGSTITRPMMVVGEEAPTHPEYIIPTNPAYRSRAVGLFGQLGQKLGVPGFAQGGRFSVNDMTSLAASVGAQVPPIMGAIGMAESSGNPSANGPPDGRGLWQIEWPIWARTMMSKGLTNAYNPEQNARMMKVVQDMQGLTAWVVYNTGAYKKYLKVGGDDGGGVLDDVTGAVGSVGGVLGDLIGGGAKFLLDKLPGIGDLPDWLQGTGRFVLDKASSYIREKVQNLLSSVTGGNAGVPLPEGVTGSVKDAIAIAMSLGHARPSINQLTGGRHAPGSYHYQGRAADFGDAGQSTNAMITLFNTFAARFGSKLKELFYDRSSFYVKNGSRVDGQFGGHDDHVHIALRKGGIFGDAPFVGSYKNGGIVPQDGFAYVHQGEEITPLGGGGVDVHVHFDDPTLRDLIRVQVKERDRASAATFRAGARA